MNNSIDALLSANVRAIMGITNETYDDVADVIGVGRNTIGNRLHGRTRWLLSDLELLAQHWGCQPIHLIQETHEVIRIVIKARRNTQQSAA